MTAWLIAQRSEMRALELERARLQGELAASERIERAGQRYADKLEEKLAEARRREASLARALGYVEAQRDRLAARLGEGGQHVLPGPDPVGRAAPAVSEVELVPEPPPARCSSPAPARRR